MDDNNFSGFGYELNKQEEAAPQELTAADAGQEAAQAMDETGAAMQDALQDAAPQPVIAQQPAPQPQPLPYQPAYQQPYRQPYAPYQGAGAYQQSAYQQGPTANPQSPAANAANLQNLAANAAQPIKRKRTGLMVFLALLAATALVGIFIIGGAVYSYIAKDGNTLSAQQQTVTKDSAKLIAADTPDGDNSVAAVKGALTPVQIHKALQDSNVAVQLYGSRNAESAMGEGSGVLIHEDSAKTYTYVVTCAHVISESNASVSVELEDGSRYDAEIVGYDTRTDVGVLKIKKTGLNGATFGDSSKLQVGEPVYAIGNPGGIEFKGSFTNGMVSAIERPIGGGYTMESIQHTAAINPGNSGGALVNAFGQVIGINSQKIVDTEYEGMGFAIPSKIVEEIVNDLISTGYVPNRPKLGIRYLAITQSRTGYVVVRANNLPSGSLIIASIDEDSVLTGTEVRANDIITHVNGKPLSNSNMLPQTVENSKVGDTLKLTIARVNQDYSVRSFDVSVKLVEDKGGAKTETEQTSPWWEDEFNGNFGW